MNHYSDYMLNLYLAMLVNGLAAFHKASGYWPEFRGEFYQHVIRMLALRNEIEQREPCLVLKFERRA